MKLPQLKIPFYLLNPKLTYSLHPLNNRILWKKIRSGKNIPLAQLLSSNLIRSYLGKITIKRIRF